MCVCAHACVKRAFLQLGSGSHRPAPTCCPALAPAPAPWGGFKSQPWLTRNRLVTHSIWAHSAECAFPRGRKGYSPFYAGTHLQSPANRELKKTPALEDQACGIVGQRGAETIQVSARAGARAQTGDLSPKPFPAAPMLPPNLSAVGSSFPCCPFQSSFYSSACGFSFLLPSATHLLLLPQPPQPGPKVV